MHVLVTGGAGFIGSALTRRLLDRGDSVTIIDNMNSYYTPFLKYSRLAHLTEGARPIIGDFAESAVVEKAFDKPVDVIAHIGAQAGVRYSLENPAAYTRSNLEGTVTLLEAARKHQVKNFVFASSSSVYGETGDVPFRETARVDKPESYYAATKKAGEEILHSYHKNYGLNCTALRFFTVYGPWGRPDMAPMLFAKKIIDDGTIDVFNNGNMSRDFTYVDDIVTGVVAAIDKPQPYEIVNIGRGQPVNLLDFVKTMESAFGKEVKKNYLPMQKGDVTQTFSDTTKAKMLYGYEPKVSLQEGIGKFAEWYKKYYK
ncbi:MAG TPA: NAD-dependent epimerase/dehydratase family protein [Acidobacteriota bacterium]|nr:NAD-dependent epimerase/dehydratase family protein [Acidobacteriota bacterium]